MLAWLIFKNYLLSRRSGALVRIIAWHCILGIGMGVAALVIVLSVMNGFNLTIRNRMLSVEPHLVIPMKTLPTAAEQAKLVAILKGVTDIERVDRYEAQDLILRSVEGVFGGVVAKGYEPASLNALERRVWRSTKQLTPEPALQSSQLAPNEIVLGVDLARSLGIFEGDEVILVPPETLLLPKGEVPHFQKFKVKSLVSTQMPEVDSKLMFYNLNVDADGGASGAGAQGGAPTAGAGAQGQGAQLQGAQGRGGTQGTQGARRLVARSLDTGFEVRLKNPHEAEEVQERLSKFGFRAQTWMERDTSLFFALKMESFAMALFLSLAVLITSFSIVTVMVLLMSQKRRDIGMFMALGLSVARTRSVFLRVGLMLSFLGILGGTFFGVTVCLILDHYPLELLPDIYTDSTLPAKLTWRILLFVLCSSSVIAVVGSWLPVWRYVLSNPSDSLRKPVV